MGFREWSVATLVAGSMLFASCKTSEKNTSEVKDTRPDRSVYDPTQMAALKGSKALSDGNRWFEEVPISSSGIPMIMFRVFPDLAPEIWGSTMEDLPQYGLPRRPAEMTRFTDDPYPLALGLGFHRSMKKIVPFDITSIQVVGLTCSGCHTGRVKLEDGSIRHLIAGTSTTFDVNGYANAIYKTVTRPDFTGAKFREIIGKKSKLQPWLFNTTRMLPQQLLEMEIFLNKKDDKGEFQSDLIVKAVRDNVKSRQDAIDTILGAHYKVNAPSLHSGAPGQADAIGKIAVTSKANPLTPAPADFPVVWRQDTREYSQYDATLANAFYRNIAAEFGATGAADINVVNADITSKFLQSMVAPKYPFAIDQAAAERGRELFNKNCASCHGLPNETKTVHVPYSVDVGASEMRGRQVDSEGIRIIAASFKNACDVGQKTDKTGWILGEEFTVDPTKCDVPLESIIKDRTKNPGTVAQVLNGIWSSAPYLHNGSVPTIRALLVPSLRPKTFYRGNLSYDQVNLGFNYLKKDPDAGSAAIYDTSLRGNGNKGHSAPAMLGGRDWGADPKSLNDLLEFMKVL